MFILGIGLLLLVGAKGQTTTPPIVLPSVFAICKDEVPVCAGVPVSITNTAVYMITPAHCVTGVSNLKVKVTQGSSIAVSRVYVHPYYSPPSMNYDIAVLAFKRPENFNKNVANLNTNQPLPTDTLLVINVNLKQIETDPVKAQAKLEERKSCRAKLSDRISITTKMICAYVQTEVDGSPLIISNGAVVGIGSHYFNRDNGTLPKIFTNIANSEIYSFINKCLPL